MWRGHEGLDPRCTQRPLGLGRWLQKIVEVVGIGHQATQIPVAGIGQETDSGDGRSQVASLDPLQDLVGAFDGGAFASAL